MEPERKRLKFSETPIELVREGLNFVGKPDLKNIYLLSTQFYQEISFLKRENTYLFILQEKVNLQDVLATKRQFNEIFFHGKQNPSDVAAILLKFGEKLKMLSFGKSDLNFLKVPSSDVISWLNCCKFLTHLNTINIELSNLNSSEIVSLTSLKKLRCGDAFLSVVHVPNLEKLKVFTIESLTNKKLQGMNNFFMRHHAIKYLSYTIYNGEDTDLQNCPFELSHLKLTNLRLLEFRYNIQDVIQIIKNQPDLIELRLEDGSYSESTEDMARVESFQPLFNEMLKLQKLEKLYIEMPSDEMMRNIPIYLKNLKVLKVCSITEEMLDTFKLIANHNVEKLCIENLEHGKKHLTVDHIQNLVKSFPNLTSFKADTLPPAVLNSTSIYMKKLKKLKIIRNEYLRELKGIFIKLKFNLIFTAQKMKKSFSETVVMQESNLERITCKYEDYKLRILPLIQVSNKLKHVKIYWDNKNIPFMQIIFEIIMACPQINLIGFPYDGVYIKTNVISFEKSFYFSFNNKDFELLINRKKGKIICKKVC